MSAPSENNSHILHETWENFGKNLEKYISSHKEYLEKESYDVILGFSRGGTILAFTFACLLKDSDSYEYSKISKASVRSIPRGVTLKRNDPCFVMDHPASRLERDDILNNLEKDLSDFSEKYNDAKPICVLIMDDNLTGATRMKFLADRLKGMKCVERAETLAYVRHKAFLETEIPTIIKFPDDIDIFVMPWHEPHSERLDLENECVDLVKLIFRMETQNDFENIKQEIENSYGFEEGFIINGASNFYLKYILQDGRIFVDLNHFPNKFYPPKICLSPQKKELLSQDLEKIHGKNKFIPLCSLGVDEKAMGTCLVCSCLNCNKKLFKKVLSVTKSDTISIIALFKNANTPKLKRGIEKWFAKSIKGVRIEGL